MAFSVSGDNFPSDFGASSAFNAGENKPVVTSRMDNKAAVIFPKIALTGTSPFSLIGFYTL